MKKSNFFILTVLFVLHISCNAKKEPINNTSSDSFITIDLDHAIEKDRIPISSYLKSASIVILESSDSTLIGRINGMQVSSKYIFILDRDITESLFVFDKTGKFIRKIGTRGDGPGEYEAIYDFTLDLNKNEVYIMDPYRQAIHKYNFESGAYMNSIQLTDPFNVARHIQLIDNKIFVDAFSGDRPLKSNIYMLAEIDPSTGVTVNKWLDLCIYSYGIDERMIKEESFFYCKTLSEPLFYKNFMDTIVVLKEGSVYSHVAIKHKNWVNQKHVDKIIKEYDPEYLYHKLEESSTIIFDLREYIESEKIIYFPYRNPASFHRCILYDKETGETFNTSGLYDEDIDFHLPKVGCCDENRVYAYIQLELMDQFLNSFLPRNETFRKNSSKYKELSELSIENNSIIFYYEYDQ